MSQRGGARAGAGRPKGSREPHTIQREIAKAAITRYTAERVLDELAVVGFSDIGDYLTARGSLKAVGEIPAEQRRALSSIKITKYNKPGTKDGIQEDVVELRLWSKLDALITLARYHGLLQDKLQVSDDRPLRDKVAKARARLAAKRGA